MTWTNSPSQHTVLHCIQQSYSPVPSYWPCQVIVTNNVVLNVKTISMFGYTYLTYNR